MIYTVGGIKGGSGKTTIATHLAVYLSNKKRDVLFVDADDQGTATDFTNWRNEITNGKTGYTAIQLYQNAVRNEVAKLKNKYDDVVIDTGGRDSTSQRAAIAITNFFLVPFIPRSFDMWTLEKVSRLIEEMSPANQNLKSLAFLNRVDPRGSDNKDASDLLKESNIFSYIDFPIGNRKSFANAGAKGLSVVELRPSDKKASIEIEKLFDNITN